MKVSTNKEPALFDIVTSIRSPGEEWDDRFDITLEPASEFYARRRVTACKHDWVDARNEAITSGEYCPKCGGIRAGNEASTNP